MRLGIGSYAYMWAIGFEGARPRAPMAAHGLIRQAVEFGVEAIQFGPNIGYAAVDLKAAREAGLEVETGVTGLEIGEAVREAGAAGIRFVRTVLQEEAENAPSPAAIESGLRALLPVLEVHGVRLGLENSVTPAADLKRMLESIASPHVGITLDTANSLAIGEGWRHVLELLAPHTLCLHLKDFRTRREWHRMGFRVAGAPAGEGDLDAPLLLGELRRAGFDGSVILEQWVPEQATLDETIALERRWARDGIAYLRTRIQE
jgi:sugar phosphate isomerase/epimerase